VATLGHQADATTRDVPAVEVDDVLVVPPDLALSDLWRSDPRDRADEGGLAHAVASEQADDLAGVDVEVDPVSTCAVP
jgi:hypothetical protein